MNEVEEALAEQIYNAIQMASGESERSRQSADFRIGPSDLGHCSEKVRRMLAGIPEVDPSDKLAAFIGTAIGDHVEQAVLKYLWPHAIIQSSVTATLQTDRGTFEIPGHPDVIVGRDVIDVKTVNGLELVRRNGPKQQQQFQRHIYGLAAFQQGLIEAERIEDIRVANVWIDRSAQEHGAHVDMQQFDPDVIRQIGWWLDEVVDAYLAGEEARKEPQFAFCEGWCGHFADCRAGETSVQGLIDDPELLTAVEILQEAKALESKAKKLKNQAQIALKGVEGSTGEFAIKWTHVNGGEVHYVREPYLRLDVRKVR